MNNDNLRGVLQEYEGKVVLVQYFGVSDGGVRSAGFDEGIVSGVDGRSFSLDMGVMTDKFSLDKVAESPKKLIARVVGEDRNRIYEDVELAKKWDAADLARGGDETVFGSIRRSIFRNYGVECDLSDVA